IALAEFPGTEVPSIVREKLVDPDSSLYAAFSIHAGGTNAVQLLIDTCQTSTQRQVRAATLGALAFGERPRKTEGLRAPRRSAYHKKWCNYMMQSLGFGLALSQNPDQDAFIAAIKSNVIHHQEARVRQTESTFLAKARARTGLVKFSPQQIP